MPGSSSHSAAVDGWSQAPTGVFRALLPEPLSPGSGWRRRGSGPHSEAPLVLAGAGRAGPSDGSGPSPGSSGSPAEARARTAGVCSGWGDPHYITFDGTYYTFLDNCTYVLVQQVVPVYGHLRVLIDNYFCDAEDGLSCPQSIIVEYQQDRVVLTRKPVRGLMTNEVRTRRPGRC